MCRRTRDLTELKPAELHRSSGCCARVCCWVFTPRLCGATVAEVYSHYIHSEEQQVVASPTTRYRKCAVVHGRRTHARDPHLIPNLALVQYEKENQLFALSCASK